MMTRNTVRKSSLNRAVVSILIMMLMATVCPPVKANVPASLGGGNIGRNLQKVQIVRSLESRIK